MSSCCTGHVLVISITVAPTCSNPVQAHYYFEGVKLAHGRDNVLAHLKENPDTAARIAQAVRVRLAEGGGRASAAVADSEDEDEEPFSLDDETLAAELADRTDAL